MNPYVVVEELENRIAEYGGSKYAVAVDSCTNALTLCLKWYSLFAMEDDKTVVLPCKTYVGVAYACKNAGLNIEFKNYEWTGRYVIHNTNIIDSARRFKKGMYEKDSLYCVSAHWGKILKIGRGGFILTDNPEAAKDLRIMRFDGRTAGVKPSEDNFIYPAMHCYMLPEEAARGLMLMNYMPDYNEDLPNDDYPDLSKFEVFK
jgi:dTDP-4-amino-4,6-dideoxygalactose transaminase